MSDVFKDLNINILTDKDFIARARLPLEDPKPHPKQSNTKKSSLDETLDSDTTLGSLLRGFAATGNRTLSYVNAGAEALGFDPVVNPKEIDGKLNYLENRKQQILEKDMSPIRKREVDAINKEVEKAQGMGAVLPIINQFKDTLTHPDEWTLQGAVENFSPSDPLNLAGVGAGSVLAKPVKSLVGKVIVGATGGAAEGAAIGGAGEYASAVGRGKSDEEAQKMAIAGTVGGVLTGGVMGAGAGAVTKPRFASDNILSKVDQHIGTHEANHASILQNDLMKTPDGDTFDPKTDIGFTREAPSVTDHPVDTLPDVDHHAVYNSVIADMLDSARYENAQVYDQARMMAESGATTDQMKSYIDNAFTPTRDDLNIDDLLNGGEPMPSRLSGMRIIDTLERNIAIAINDPMSARTNEYIKTALKKEGVSSELTNVYVKAYSAKDPTILTEYIEVKTAPLRDDIRAQIDEHFTSYKNLGDTNKANAYMNFMDILDEQIKNSIETPEKSPTNVELLKEVQKAGMSKDLNHAFIQAYTAKDPSIFTEYVSKNIEFMRDDLKVPLRGRIDAYRPMAQSINADNLHFDNADVINQLNEQALHMNPRADVLSLTTDFNSPIKTPIFESKISIDKLLNHIAEKDDFERRIEYVNLIKPTLEKPLFITHEDGRYRFFKTFIDDNDKTTKFLTVIEDDKGEFIGITMTPLKNTDVRNLLKGDIVWGGDTLSAISTPQRLNEGGSLNESLLQNGTDVKPMENSRGTGGSDEAIVYDGVDSEGNSVYRSFGEMRKALDDEAQLIKMVEDCLL